MKKFPRIPNNVIINRKTKNNRISLLFVNEIYQRLNFVDNLLTIITSLFPNCHKSLIESLENKDIEYQ